MTEVSCLLQQLCAPRVNNFEVIYKIYQYMSKKMKHNRGCLLFYPMLQDIDDCLFDDQSKAIDQWR